MHESAKKKNFQPLHVSYSLSSELFFQSSRLSEDQIFRKRKMTGTNHSKTHKAVEAEPRIVDAPGGAAQSISFVVPIATS